MKPSFFVQKSYQKGFFAACRKPADRYSIDMMAAVRQSILVKNGIVIWI